MSTIIYWYPITTIAVCKTQNVNWCCCNFRKLHNLVDSLRNHLFDSSILPRNLNVSICFGYNIFNCIKVRLLGKGLKLLVCGLFRMYLIKVVRNTLTNEKCLTQLYLIFWWCDRYSFLKNNHVIKRHLSRLYVFLRIPHWCNIFTNT